MKKKTLLGLICALLVIAFLGVTNSLLKNELKQQKATTDSLLAVNADYARMVVPCVPDTSIKMQIPENVKMAWLEYSRVKMLAEEDFEKGQSVPAKIKQEAVQAAGDARKKKDDEAGKYYDDIEKKSLMEFVANYPSFGSLVLNPGNMKNTYVYLGSRDSYWSADFGFTLNNVKSNEKCPDGFKKVVAKCKEADSVASKIKTEAAKVFEQKKAKAEENYDKVVKNFLATYKEKVDGAYLIFRAKTK